MNNALFIISIIVAFFGVALVAKFFGKVGLTAWIAVATILANIAVTKQVNLLGISTALGNVMFASTYLCSDILSEVFGLKDSRKAVNIGFFSAIGFVAFSQMLVAFIPNEFDFIQPSMKDLMAMTIRTTSCSVLCFYIANLADVYLFEKLKEKMPDKLWLRNNVCTIVCNCGENFIFSIAAFYGIMSMSECITIAIGGSIVEAVIAVCDTPFAYLGRKWCLKE